MQKLLHIEVTVTLAGSKKIYSYNFEEYTVILDLYDAGIFIYDTGKIEIMLTLG